MTTRNTAPPQTHADPARPGVDPGASHTGRDDLLTRLITSRRNELLGGIRCMGTQMGLGTFEKEDVFQDTVVSCLRGLHTLHADTERGIRAWFLGIARNHLRQRVRRRSRTRISVTGGFNEDSHLPATPSSDASDVDLSYRPSSHVLWNRKSDRRSVILLRELFQLTWTDVATVLSRPSGGAARSLHSRARL